MLGRPPKYKTPKDMQKKIDEYFADDSQVHTISGLAIYLGFCDRQSLRDYAENKPDFTCVIKGAIAKISAKMEAALQKSAGQVAGPIFWLKNHNWRDEQDLRHSVGEGISELFALVDGKSKGSPSKDEKQDK